METHYKLVISGSVLEFYRYKNPVNYGPKDTIRKERPFIDAEPESYEDTQVENAADKNLASTYRAKREVRRLIGSNAWAWKDPRGKPYMPMFLTLTFAENVTDLTLANKIFTKHTKRLNYFLWGDKQAQLKYVGVPEFQKRGAVHYHLVCFNLPFISNAYDELSRIWGQGFINLKPVKNVGGAIQYVSKYLAKDIDDDRLVNHKRYLASRGLLRPIIMRDEQTVDILLKEISKTHKGYTFHMSNVPWCGDIDYTRFLLKPGVSLSGLALDDISQILIKYAQQTQQQNP